MHGTALMLRAVAPSTAAPDSLFSLPEVRESVDDPTKHVIAACMRPVLFLEVDSGHAHSERRA